MDKVTNKSKGYGYVWFASADSAFKAIKHSHTGLTPFLAYQYRPKLKEDAEFITRLLTGLLSTLT